MSKDTLVLTCLLLALAFNSIAAYNNWRTKLTLEDIERLQHETRNLIRRGL